MRPLRPALLLLLLPGCYYVTQGAGQLEILLNRTDIERALRSDDLSPGQKTRLRLVLDIKDFAEQEIHLAPSDNYSTYYEVREGHISWLVSACAADSFRPYVWTYPVVGDLPYKGFFDKTDAEKEAEERRREGYDVALHPVSAYSTLGWFSDPVLSTMLRLPEEDLAALILHELTHGTLFVPDRADFNEALGSFVGTTASLQYLRSRFGTDSEPYRRAVEGIADRATFALFTEKLFQKLDALYRAPGGRRQKLEERERIFREARREYRSLRETMNTGDYDYFEGMTLNNAELLAERRYSNDEPFRKLFEQVNGDWERFWVLLRSQSGIPQGPPKGVGR